MQEVARQYIAMQKEKEELRKKLQAALEAKAAGIKPAQSQPAAGASSGSGGGDVAMDDITDAQKRPAADEGGRAAKAKKGDGKPTDQAGTSLCEALTKAAAKAAQQRG